MTRCEKIEELLGEMTIADLVSIHNEFCKAANYFDNYIYLMDEFDEIMSGLTPWEIARSTYYGTFSPVDKYFWFNGYGNLDSDHFPTNIFVEDIAEYIDRTENALYNDEIQEILDEEEEEE